ncbi:MAG: HAD-IC family P-type ATPase, partial [Burkholderiales bacterium]|nr:HAD-IC family P-type ATPase [Burkholderiales bacterium]
QQTIKIVQFASGNMLQIGGEGYNADGLIQTMDNAPLSANQQALLTQVALAGAIANEGSLFHSPTGWQHNGDEVDVAFLALAYKAGISTDFKSQISELELTPYQSEHKYSGARCKFQQQQLSVVKGAVETILAQAKYQLTDDGNLTELDTATIERNALNLTAQGYRVMAIAHQTAAQANLVLLALVGMQDPLRAESISAVAACQKAGITVCMVTGDHPSTALAIARELGIATSESEVIGGSELETLQAEQPQDWQNLIRHKRVFARVNPLQKMQIVTALHKLGHYIAVTGDGVNDVPALQKANIGIAMGSGCDLTKDSADIILLNDDFSSIVAGVEEGRYAYDNIRKVTYMSVSSAIGEIFLLLVAVTIGMPLPLIAIQILWVNLICNGMQDVALAFEAGDIESMRQVPRAKNERIFNRLMIEESVIAGLALGGICLGFWLAALKLGISEYHARSLLFILLIFLENIHAFNCRSEQRSVFQTPLRNNYFVVIAVLGAQLIQVIIAQIPFMQRVLHIDIISWREWLMLFALSLLLLLIMELYKFFKSRPLKITPTHAK